jgi:hypothetical protein
LKYQPAAAAAVPKTMIAITAFFNTGCIDQSSLKWIGQESGVIIVTQMIAINCGGNMK